ncbi:MAG TPA: universal stress protein [Burkholderiales bacterium]|jgi:nucleotide-binding universal stress UspA family protein
MKILVAVDGSKPSLKVVQRLVEHCDWYRERPEVDLVTVHLPVPKVGHIAKAQLDRYYAEEGEGNLAAAKKKLDAAGVPYRARILVGPIAESLVKHAKDQRCDLIYIGTRGLSGVGAAILGSTAIKVLHISETPVLLVK